MSNAPLTAERWLYTTLNGDTTLMALVTGVYSEAAPETATYPFVVFRRGLAADVMGVGTVRIMSHLPYTVVVVGRCETFSTLETAANRVDTLLHAKYSGSMLACVRVAPYSDAGLEGGIEYRQLGGEYRLTVQ